MALKNLHPNPPATIGSYAFESNSEHGIHPSWLIILTSIWLATLGNLALWQELVRLPEMNDLRALWFGVAFALLIASLNSIVLSLLCWRWTLKTVISVFLIAAALNISKGVVTKYLSLATAAGLDWAQVQCLDDAALHNRLFGSPQRASGFVQPDYARLHQELRRKGMTLMLLWPEHVSAHPEESTHRYSQFCVNYRSYAKTLKRSMRQVHRAGEKLFIDYAGPTLALTDGSRAHIFVAALGASCYTFAYATPRETMADWLGATAQALRFSGGVTQ